MRAAKRKLPLIIIGSLLTIALLFSGCSPPSLASAPTPAPTPTSAPAPTPTPTLAPAPTPEPASVSVSPVEATNPVKKQHTVVATVKEADGSPAEGAEVHWILNRFPDAVGDIVKVSNQTKVDNLYAISHTDADGKATMAITATREGDTDVTVFVPGIADPDKHKVFAVKHWVDMMVDWPEDAANKIGTDHPFSVKVYRATNKLPLAGIKVKWTITDDDPDLMFTGCIGCNEALNSATSSTDANGIASVVVKQVAAAPGENTVHIDVLSKDGIVLYSHDVSKKWLSPTLNILKEGPSLAKLDSSVEYTITVRNDGDETATGVKVADQVPEGLIFVSSTPIGTVSKSTVTWSLGDLAPNTSSKIVAKFTAAKVGKWTNTVKATSKEGLTAEATAVLTVPAVTMTKSGPSTIYLDYTGQFTITVNNIGKTPLTSVKVTDTLPANLTYVSATPSGIASDGIVTWTFASLAGGASETITVLCKATGLGPFENSASVTTAEGVSDTAKSTGEVLAKAGVTMQLSDTVDPVAIGAQTTYEVSITNQSIIPVHDLKVQVQLPPKVSFVSASGITAYSVVGQTVTFAPVATLDGGESIQFTVTAKAESAGDTICKVILTYAEFSLPITLEEGTTIFAP